MEQLSTNILIIGKSGTGKSSLLNYMFGKELRKTGTGAASTSKGVFPEEYMYGDMFLMRIYDTWGIEAGKDKEWEKLIFDEVEKHEKKHIREWFSTVVICLSANSQRLEPFEETVIRRLLSKWKTNVTVVITHCRDQNDERALSMKEAILASTKDEDMNPDDIILVNSVAKKLIGQKSSGSLFGRDEVFLSIIRNLWEAFQTKVPFKVRRYVNKRFEEKRNEFCRKTDLKHFLFKKLSEIEDIEYEINREYVSFVYEMIQGINMQFKDAAQYYHALSMTYADIGLEINVEDFSTSKLKFNAMEKFERDIRSIFDAFSGYGSNLVIDIKNDRIIELLAEAKAYFTSRKRIKEELSSGIKKHMDKAQSALMRQLDDIEERIHLLNIGECM